MNPLRLCLTLVLAAFTPLLRAQPAPANADVPLHPGAVTTQINRETVPVVAVVGNKPQIELEGKIVPAPDSAVFSFVRLPTFGPGLVTVTDQRTDPGQTTDGRPTERYRARIHSDVSVPSAFFVLVVFDREFLTNAGTNPSTSVFFAELGSLEANASEDVGIDLGTFTDVARERMQYFPLIFAGGREIKTQLAQTSATFFRRLEVSRHASLVANYLAKNAGADKPLQPYLRVAPIIPRDTGAPSGPMTVNARIAVDDEGFVSSVELPADVPPGLTKELERAMRGWLFLPKLEKGKPIAAKARLPLQLTLP